VGEASAFLSLHSEPDNLHSPLTIQMPLYEFRCPSGHDFERFFRSISAAPAEVACPECGAIAERRISAGGFHFKGSGFYITDYGKDGKKAEREAAKAKADKPSAQDAKAGESGVGTESKPAESPAPKKEAKPAPAPAAGPPKKSE
jgi:putative FmdB family regulatory protein